MGGGGVGSGSGSSSIGADAPGKGNCDGAGGAGDNRDPGAGGRLLGSGTVCASVPGWYSAMVGAKPPMKGSWLGCETVATWDDTSFLVLPRLELAVFLRPVVSCLSSSVTIRESDRLDLGRVLSPPSLAPDL